MDEAVLRAPVARDDVRVRAQITLGAAAVAGIATQALFWRAEVGLSWLVLVAMLAASTWLALGARADSKVRGARPLAAGALVTSAALVLGGAVAWRASEWALWIAVPASAALLALLPFVIAGRMRLAELGSLPRALWREGVRRVPAAVVASVDVPRRALDSTGRAHALRIAKGMAIGVPVTAVFVALLAADPGFRGAVVRAVSGSDHVLHFGALAAVSAALYLVAYVLHTRARGDASAVVPSALPYRRTDDLRPADEARPPIVRPLTWSVVLAQLVGVFAVFVAVNARTLFAGHAFLMARGTPTYAGYLHAGFAQLTIAAVLTIVVVLVGQRLVRSPDGAPLARASRVALATLEAALLGLAAVTLASCAQRLHLYDEMYGYTYLRLGVALCQLAAAVVLALTFAKAAAPSWRGYAASLVVATMGLAVLAGTLDADGFIARANVARANAGRPLDLDYLESLGADAAVVLGDPYFKAHPDEARELSSAWYAQRVSLRTGDWRSWRGLAW
jgi:hypothetical protein